jgi:hypothetical protein
MSTIEGGSTHHLKVTTSGTAITVEPATPVQGTIHPDGHPWRTLSTGLCGAPPRIPRA